MTEMLETLLQACIAFLKIGAFSFGGGYAVVLSLIHISEPTRLALIA